VGIGARVRVKQEIEDIIKIVSRITGYARFSIRNYALLKGLSSILEDYIATQMFPDIDDDALSTLINMVRSKAEEAKRIEEEFMEILKELEEELKEGGEEL